MRDPFRTNAKKQLIREAQIGLSVVAVLLALFLYVAFFKITGRGKHLPDYVRRAPIANTVWPGASPEVNSAASPETDLDVGAQRPEMTASNRKSIDGDLLKSDPISPNKSHHSSLGNELDSFKPLGPGSKVQMTENSRSQTNPKPPEKTKLANRFGRSVRSFLGHFGTANKAQNTIAKPVSDRSNNFSPPESAAAAMLPQTESRTAQVVEPKTFSKSEFESQAYGPGSLDVNDLRTAKSLVPQIKTSRAGLMENRPEVHLASAESKAIELASGDDFEPNQDFDSVDDDDPGAFRPTLPESSGNENRTGQPSPNVLPDDSSRGDFEPAGGNNGSLRGSLPSVLTSSPGTTALETANNSWQGNSQYQFPPIGSQSELKSAQTPTLRSPQPLPHVATERPKRLPRPIQEDIARAIDGDESNSSLERRLQPIASLADTMARPATYTVGEGDSYWSVAAIIYGDGRFFRALYEHNKSVAPSFELVPGTKLATPELSDLVKLWPDHCPREESGLAVEESRSESASRIYVTQRGDTLFEIAGQKLGQASRYLDVYRLNQTRLDSKVDHLSPLPAGLRLVLPAQ